MSDHKLLIISRNARPQRTAIRSELYAVRSSGAHRDYACQAKTDGPATCNAELRQACRNASLRTQCERNLGGSYGVREH